MWRFKGCPRCGGDVFIDYDLNGWYEECLQCSCLHELKTTLQVKEEKPKKEELALAGHHKRTPHNKFA